MILAPTGPIHRWESRHNKYPLGMARVGAGPLIQHVNPVKEIDFLVVKNDTPFMFLEVKLVDDQASAKFVHFGKYFSGIKKVQLVKDLKREKTFPGGVEIRAAGRWLATISFGP
ncbi:MAG: hypothetical protein JJV98_05930 [Desulfosarcina sp.]|nr:hypothetical protein [Desulfobacterales bacterium]